MKNRIVFNILLIAGFIGITPLHAQVFGAQGKSDNSVQNFVTKAQSNNSVQFKPVAENNSQVNIYKEKPTIKIYMDHFEIVPSFSKMIRCTMTFQVKSTLETSISNISFRLKWPDMETPLSFDNVTKENPASKKYTLHGKGCYNLDTPPTIIVNRCRVKGLTQEACSNLIEWAK